MCITIFWWYLFDPHHPSFNIAAAILPLTGMFVTYFCEVFFSLFIIVGGNTLPFVTVFRDCE